MQRHQWCKVRSALELTLDFGWQLAGFLYKWQGVQICHFRGTFLFQLCKDTRLSVEQFSLPKRSVCHTCTGGKAWLQFWCNKMPDNCENLNRLTRILLILALATIRNFHTGKILKISSDTIRAIVCLKNRNIFKRAYHRLCTQLIGAIVN